MSQYHRGDVVQLCGYAVKAVVIGVNDYDVYCCQVDPYGVAFVDYPEIVCKTGEDMLALNFDYLRAFGGEFV